MGVLVCVCCMLVLSMCILWTPPILNLSFVYYYFCFCNFRISPILLTGLFFFCERKQRILYELFGFRTYTISCKWVCSCVCFVCWYYPCSSCELPHSQFKLCLLLFLFLQLSHFAYTINWFFFFFLREETTDIIWTL